ncbi:MAG: hypothetical protein KGL39_49655 [Patescibacteria group bacterium]|nr:hypothetical protein [Patescibacteria group bacterium]
MFSVNFKQTIFSVFGAILTAVVQQLYTSTSGASFNVATYDWASLSKTAALAFIGFILAHFFTTSDGRPLGIGKKQAEQVQG